MGFEDFWKAYPRKRAKARALKAWMKNVSSSSTPTVLKALAVHKRLRQWNIEDGRYIPHPATWLNDHAWMDEPSPSELIPTPQQVRVVQDKNLKNYKHEVERSWEGVEDPAAWLRKVKEQNMARMRGKPDDDRIQPESVEAPFDMKPEDFEVPF